MGNVTLMEKYVHVHIILQCEKIGTNIGCTNFNTFIKVKQNLIQNIKFSHLA